MDDRSHPGMVMAAILVLLAVMYLTWLYFERSLPGDRPGSAPSARGRAATAFGGR